MQEREDMNVQQYMWSKGNVQTLMEQKNFLENGTYYQLIISMFGMQFFNIIAFIWYLVTITSQN